MKQVYEFKDGGKEMVALLGGKGANLAEMAKIDLPIPKGIIISTTACNDYFKKCIFKRTGSWIFPRYFW